PRDIDLRNARWFVITLVLSGSALAQTPKTDFWETNESTNAGAIVGNTLYIGGDFSYVGPHTGSFATLDAMNGSAAGIGDVDGTVFAATPDNAGGWFIGGAFSEVGGQRRKNLAHITGDGSVSSWNPGADGDVLTIELNGSRLYVGGRFTSTGGATRTGLAALD